MWVYGAQTFDFFCQIVALVKICMEQYATFERVFWYAGTTSQQFTTTIGAIAVHHHLIPFALIEWFAIRHAQNLYFLSVGLGEVYLVVDTACRIEIECIVLESSTLLVFLCVVIQAEGMVVWRCHRVAPHIVRELQMLSNFLTSHLEDKEQILKTIKLKHISLSNLACINSCVECQWGIE